MIYLLIYVVLVAVVASLMKRFIHHPPSACTGACRQGRDCTCCRENRDA